MRSCTGKGGGSVPQSSYINATVWDRNVSTYQTAVQTFNFEPASLSSVTFCGHHKSGTSGDHPGPLDDTVPFQSRLPPLDL